MALELSRAPQISVTIVSPDDINVGTGGGGPKGWSGSRPRGIDEVHRIVLYVRIAVERLRVRKIITTVVRIGLVETVQPGIVAAVHGVVATRQETSSFQWPGFKGGLQTQL